MKKKLLKELWFPPPVNVGLIKSKFVPFKTGPREKKFYLLFKKKKSSAKVRQYQYRYYY